MQSSGQQPQEKIERENAEVEDTKDQAATPLYEFPADYQGMVYPPPPSYYQNMEIPTDRAPLPPRPDIPDTSLRPQTVAMQAPPFAPVRYPGAQTPIKKSRKWVWIIISIFGVGFLITCGLCSWGGYQLFDTIIQSETGATDVVNTYFQDVQKQRYAEAYQNLQIKGLTLNSYTTLAQASDTQNGALLSFAPEQPSVDTSSSTGPDLTKWTFTVNVTRSNKSYPVLLTVENTGGSWKITYIDRY
jgi:hypothetical protein